MICRSCGIEIVPSSYGLWAGKDSPGYEECGDSTHEPRSPVRQLRQIDATKDILPLGGPEWTAIWRSTE